MSLKTQLASPVSLSLDRNCFAIAVFENISHCINSVLFRIAWSPCFSCVDSVSEESTFQFRWLRTVTGSAESTFQLHQLCNALFCAAESLHFSCVNSVLFRAEESQCFSCVNFVLFRAEESQCFSCVNYELFQAEESQCFSCVMMVTHYCLGQRGVNVPVAWVNTILFGTAWSKCSSSMGKHYCILFGTAWSKCSSCMGTLYCSRQRGVIVSFAVTQHCPGQCGVNDLCPVTGSMEQCDLVHDRRKLTVLTSMEMICVLFRIALSHGLTGISLRI